MDQEMKTFLINSKKFWDLYEGIQYDYTKEMLTGIFDQATVSYYDENNVEQVEKVASLAEKVPIDVCNIIGQIVGARSKGLSRLKIRFVSDNDQKKWDEFLDEQPLSLFDDIAAAVELYQKATVSLVDNPTKNCKIDVEVLKPHDLIVELEPGTRQIKRARLVEWKDDSPDEGKEPRSLNGLMPIELRQSKRGSYYLPLRESLLQSQLVVNYDLFLLNVQKLYQGKSVLVIKGARQRGGVIPITSNRAIDVDVDGDAQYISPDSKISDLIEAHKLGLKRVFKEYCMSEDYASADQYGAESGYAIKLRSIELNEYVDKTIPIYKRFLKKFIAQVGAVYAEKGSVPFGEYTIEVLPRVVERSPDEIMRQEKHDLELGVLDLVDVVMSRYGKNEEDAKAYLDARSDRKDKYGSSVQRVGVIGF